MMRAAVLVALCVTLSPAADADEGEFSVDAAVGVSAATLQHPSTEPTARSLLAVSALPRLSLGFQYGVTSSLVLSAAVETAATPGVITPEFSAGGETAQLITGTYGELAVPLSLSWRFDFGSGVAVTPAVSAGPIGALWALNAVVDANAKSPEGRPPRLPIDVEDELRLGALVRIESALELRVFDPFTVDVVPHADLAWVGVPSGRIGVDLRLRFVLDLLPL